MNIQLRFSVLATLFIMAFSRGYAEEVEFAPPYTRGVNHTGVRNIFSTNIIDGEYNENTCAVSITFMKDVSNVEIFIYKDGSICEQETEISVRKADFKDYLLSIYGTGKYVICIKANGIVVVSEEIEL